MSIEAPELTRHLPAVLLASQRSHTNSISNTERASAFNPDVVKDATHGQNAECSGSKTLLHDITPHKPCVTNAPRAGTMPSFLQKSGNLKAWNEVVRHIKNRAGPILLSGPHGCGKTRGVHELATKHLGMSVYELNPGNVCSTDIFLRDARHVTQSKTLLGPRLLLIDDIEGFDESFVSATLQFFREQTSRHGVVILTCHDFYDRRILKLRTLGLNHTKMSSPSPHAMLAAVRGHVHIDSTAIAERYARESAGNFHQFVLKLRTHAKTRPDEHVGLFETTDALLTDRTTVQQWVRSAESHILVTLLRENACQLAQLQRPAADGLDAVCAFFDLVSFSASHAEHIRMQEVGMAARETLALKGRTPRLTLPKRTYSSKRASDRDMPAILRDAADGQALTCGRVPTAASAAASSLRAIGFQRGNNNALRDNGKRL